MRSRVPMQPIWSPARKPARSAGEPGSTTWTVGITLTGSILAPVYAVGNVENIGGTTTAKHNTDKATTTTARQLINRVI
ncbi:MAG TPA: hypothetical protein VGG89_12540 [Candidatus Baltobacteraceae bacterium]